MHTGVVKLFCPICGKVIIHDENKARETVSHCEFGIVCNRVCLISADTKYTKMILGKDENNLTDLYR
jgi:hypothetical protein